LSTTRALSARACLADWVSGAWSGLRPPFGVKRNELVLEIEEKYILDTLNVLKYENGIVVNADFQIRINN